jgi:hypothetical protein
MQRKEHPTSGINATGNQKDPPPQTSAPPLLNLSSSQKYIKALLSDQFSLRITGAGVRTVIRRVADYTAMLPHLQSKRRQTSIPLAGFEPTIPVFKRAKTFHALDRAATVTGMLE